MPATPTNTDPVTVEQILTEGQLLFETSDLYFGHGTDNAWDEAVFLVFYALDLPPDADRSVLNQQLTDIQCKAIHQLFEQRIRDRIPAAYLTGRAWFCGLPFAVDKRVIIPRSPIAELIMSGFHPWCSTEPQRLLDLCTGSGCIGIACAYAFENAEVVLSDICADALQVAQQNIQQHDLAARVSAVQSDLFENLADQKFDLIVSNPPYVDADDYASMPDEYFHEPELALASGNDGLDFTRRLLREAHDYLTEHGVLIVEVGNSGEALDRLFPSVPFLWLEFSEGDGGVFLLTRDQLLEHRESFE
ncbi:MAG: 50S ribosomal protein L3 N(5)-glutamine methyltransferase [Porticoccaceae bacterium]|jgi:ribosomal protein L3 glutamine methyltransferase|nr:MAG: protein-(glutamine-N5) methyltransferase, ribosomal protein L3-specific [SAR92 bacterium BACL16 MAG-120619-bin48]MDP4653701.1 50S ribosomal protein L3 N(5)-glutamine methyltransferase [Alphaproteobacteria bacterium]MDP4746158.1 50S ribosomal protein L3 N(5)-glutamine methyltransferase [Porticoccaceae bacterium]MDP4752849.1 50S ribosomal protein L3 N(5)-glutamine methyltransferase [Porticoccaceae bacterium]MDP4889659.1 50S ribosomal protein L3 N(5)-glutamine methyltransferase [Porticocca